MFFAPSKDRTATFLRNQTAEAIEILIEEKIGGIPDEEAGLVGSVTYVDVLRCFHDRLNKERDGDCEDSQMKRNEAAKVKKIMMGAPVTLKPEDTLNLANDIMSLGRIRHIPIVENGRLVGILSQRDLFGAAVNTVFNLRPKEKREMLKNFQIKDAMHGRVVTTAPDTTIQEAARLMAENKIGCLPIVEGDKLVGLITATNILRYLAQG